jgi:P2 family phage contractile tail tube protein
MGFPSKLKNFNIFLNGNSYMGVAKEVVLPKFMVKMEEWRGGGMLGPIKIDVGLGVLETDFTLGGISAQAIAQFGQTAFDGTLLRFAGAYQDDSSGAVTACEYTVTGRYEEIDLGNANAGGDTDHKYKMPNNYAKLVINGVTVIEIDMLSMLYMVNGVDRYAQIRAAISA